jgi:hypothetical protein
VWAAGLGTLHWLDCQLHKNNFRRTEQYWISIKRMEFFLAIALSYANKRTKLFGEKNH